MSGHLRALARDADAVVQPVRTGWHGDALPGAMILGWQRTIGLMGCARFGRDNNRVYTGSQ